MDSSIACEVVHQPEMPLKYGAFFIPSEAKESQRSVAISAKSSRRDAVGKIKIPTLFLSNV
ncbi:hypothetical protein POV26_11695 [Aequorivita todarodis]|uniref:hypothetical protein n=1 Tax=Aequorivita todarodis TaxID=2036821 RepID=UPI0023503F6B|nr:hypothetical protein [Aequorivita todarodis]MDC8001702.1 hypothetical protein [Aequorivita todarodis]